jgi:hypothetical protein
MFFAMRSSPSPAAVTYQPPVSYISSLPIATQNNQLNVGNIVFGTLSDGSGKTYPVLFD